MRRELRTHVFVWGLNDKEQLGGPKGSKIKLPVLNEMLSVLKVSQIIGGSKTLFCVTQDGKVYACGEATGGRLGLGIINGTMPVPRLINSLSQYVVKKVAVHPGGRHCLALTIDGKVFSWGEGEDGKLGHFSRANCDKPKLIEALRAKRIRDIACGSSHSAAITSNGELYTWGNGEYGRLGHGDAVTQLRPKQVRALAGQHVIQVALGSRDAQTLALTEDGRVYSWGDGDFGKLGRGGSEGCSIPHIVDRLSREGVCEVACGAQFSVALTKSGQVWTWGKGDYYRLGHGTDGHVRKPQLVESLKSKKIVHIAVGALHCLAVTESGQVYAWGDNDHGQQGNATTTVNHRPALVQGLEGYRITRVACGSSHSIAWCASDVSTPTSQDPVLFTSTRDPLGASLMGLNTSASEEKIVANSIRKSNYPSLSRLILSLESRNAKINAVDSVLHGLFITWTREAIVVLLSNETLLKQETLNPDTIQSSKSEASIEAGINLHVLARASPTSSLIITADLNTESLTASDKTAYDLDDFIKQLGQDDTRQLIDLLKLALASRCVASEACPALANCLDILSQCQPQVSEMLVELCVTELEDVAADPIVTSVASQPIVQESPHPYTDDSNLAGQVRIPGAESLRIEFDRQCSTERRHDPLTIMDASGRVVGVRSGRDWSDWCQELRVTGDELRWKFLSDSSVNGWGWKFTVYPVLPTFTQLDSLSDRKVLSRPSMELVICLLDLRPEITGSNSVITRLISALATCSQLSSLDSPQRVWALNKLRQLKLKLIERSNEIMPAINNVDAESSSGPANNMCVTSFAGSVLMSLLKFLPHALKCQFEYEDPIIRSGKQLMHSSFFKSLAALACDLHLDQMVSAQDPHKWAWFMRYCSAARVAEALLNRTQLPTEFCEQMMKKIREIAMEDEVITRDHESHELFTKEHDEELIMWLNRRPDDWTLSWGGSTQIWGWGHNHRGQLGGVEGAKVKLPTNCENLASLRPIQIIGGEQTLFAVTADGKVYATGYGAGGRLGLGGSESVSVLTLIESLQHLFIKKVAVNSGGKHCLALSVDGEVFSWGEGDDGKLGHGTRSPCDRPRVIEALRGKEVVDVSAGGAHSACVLANGDLYTWGKGRYGRLGHGDSEDQVRPKLVEALRGNRVIDVACGSGDAQMLCITEDDSVWSWGDGDYGKLGRGGSDGCKVPMRIDTLQGCGVIKVECGSQFSVALTRSGAVYSWGKGDYHRLGHGTDDHVRRPKRLAALQGVKIVAIACGSLHCIACTDNGDVYTWGDNDEGQLGDGTTNSIPRPRLISALQGKKTNRVACGSAHTFAWSTLKPANASRLPPNVPMEFNHLHGLPMTTLRFRLILLHHFSDLFCASLPMFDLSQPTDSVGKRVSSQITTFGSLNGLISSSAKETAFRRVVQATMIRDRQHGPVIEINRIQVKRSRTKGGPAGPGGLKSVFGQVCSKMSQFSPDSFMLPHRVWKVKFVGESVDDCGGGYSESIAEMCDELQNGAVPLLIQTPNGRVESGSNRDCFLLNPNLRQLPTHDSMFRFFGVLCGIAIRTGSPLSINLAEPVWKQLAGLSLTISDLTEMDKDFVPGIMCIRDMDDASLRAADMPFSTPSSDGKEVHLSSRYSKITPENKLEYVKQALNFRLHEFDLEVDVIQIFYL